MHRLGRSVRFSINPFSDESADGFNSYASKPCGEGLCLHFSLWVELAGEVGGDTGFVVNVVDIDHAVRRFVVPIFDEHIRGRFGKTEAVGLADICQILKQGWEVIGDRFSPAKLNRLCVELNPFRKIAIESEDSEMVYFSEKFEFSAMHILWNEEFSNERNFEVFGKCANPAGHGHNYVVEVTVKKAVEGKDFCISDFEKVVAESFIRTVDHKNLNVDVVEFKSKNPTVENIAAFAWDRVAGKFGIAKLSNITVWENDRTYCSYKK